MWQDSCLIYVKFFCKERHQKTRFPQWNFHPGNRVSAHIHYFISLIHRSAYCQLLIYYSFLSDLPRSPDHFPSSSLSIRSLASGACLPIFSWKPNMETQAMPLFHDHSATADLLPFLCTWMRYLFCTKFPFCFYAIFTICYFIHIFCLFYSIFFGIHSYFRIYKMTYYAYFERWSYSVLLCAPERNISFPLYPSRVYVEYYCISTHKELYLYVVLFKIHKCIFHTLFNRTVRIKASLRNPWNAGKLPWFG